MANGIGSSFSGNVRAQLRAFQAEHSRLTVEAHQSVPTLQTVVSRIEEYVAELEARRRENQALKHQLAEVSSEGDFDGAQELESRGADAVLCTRDNLENHSLVLTMIEEVRDVCGDLLCELPRPPSSETPVPVAATHPVEMLQVPGIGPLPRQWISRIHGARLLLDDDTLHRVLPNYLSNQVSLHIEGLWRAAEALEGMERGNSMPIVYEQNGSSFSTGSRNGSGHSSSTRSEVLAVWPEAPAPEAIPVRQAPSFELHRASDKPIAFIEDSVVQQRARQQAWRQPRNATAEPNGSLGGVHTRSNAQDALLQNIRNGSSLPLAVALTPGLVARVVAAGSAASASASGNVPAQFIASANAVAAARATNAFSDGGPTLIVRNIPARCTRDNLLDIWPPQTWHYNLLHIPYDHTKKTHAGNAFINFLSPAAAHEFCVNWDGIHLMPKARVKVLSIGNAQSQGFRAYIQDMVGRSRTNRYKNKRDLPVVIQDDGSFGDFKAVLRATREEMAEVLDDDKVAEAEDVGYTEAFSAVEEFGAETWAQR